MGEPSRSTRICAGTRLDGRPCTANALNGGAFCFAHDPAREAERQAARAKGGHNRSAAARAEKLIPETLRPVLEGLIDTFNGVKDGKVDPKRGTALGSIARAIVAVYQSATLEERVAALEASLAAQTGEDDR